MFTPTHCLVTKIINLQEYKSVFMSLNHICLNIMYCSYQPPSYSFFELICIISYFINTYMRLIFRFSSTIIFHRSAKTTMTRAVYLNAPSAPDPRLAKTVKLGERSFAIGGPSAWNNLSEAVNESENQKSFKQILKTHLFSICYSRPMQT